MKITEMTVSTFWKGELGIKGTVTDQEQSYKVNLFVKGSQVRDYSCSCVNGNSFRGMCEHAKLMWETGRKELKPEIGTRVMTSQEVRTMIREYTNREVARITAEGDAGEIRLIPKLYLMPGGVELELVLNKDRTYMLKDLITFGQAMEDRAYVEYGKHLAFYHDVSVFAQDCRELALFVTDLVSAYKEYYHQFRKNAHSSISNLNRLKLNRGNLDRFMTLMQGTRLEIRISGGVSVQPKITGAISDLPVTIERTGSDGVRISIDTQWYYILGEQYLYLGNKQALYCLDEEATEALKVFIVQMIRRTGKSHEVVIQERDMPLFYERVLHKIAPYCRIDIEEGLELESYRPEELKARFEFDSSSPDEIVLKPELSYGDYHFHPVEDERVPKTVCRDVPGEFRISRVITRYFHHREADCADLIIREDEQALYELLTRGIPEFAALGEVTFTESAKRLQVMTLSKIGIDVKSNDGWLDLTIDTGGLDHADFQKILQAYTEKKPYYRLADGSFLELNDHGLKAVAAIMGEFRSLHVPKYRALYLDQLLKGEKGVAFYRDNLFKAVVRGMKSVEDSDYEVPESLKPILRGYQKYGFRWLKTLDSYGFGGILADDMGLGKTLQVISLFLYEKEHAGRNTSLVVCPASLVYNWENEINTFAPELVTRVVLGSVRERHEILEQDDMPDVLITSYDLLKRDIECYQNRHFRFQILDEAQYIKNAGTQNAKAVKVISAQTRFALTGTPIENRLGELWSIFEYLMPGFLFSHQRFRKEYENPISRGDNPEALERLRLLIGPFVLRRLKKEVLKELPDKLETVVYTRLEGEQRSLYIAYAYELKRQLELAGEDQIRRENIQILTKLMRLRQICCNPVLCYDNYKGEAAKLETCMELIYRGIDGGHKILLFSQFTTMLKIIKERLQKEGVSSYMLTGATSKEERLRMVQGFQVNEVPIFLISLKAGGTGLNLTAADMVIHYDPWWNVAAQNQATDRAHRIGQEKQVNVYQLIVKDTIEENIQLLQKRKQSLADQVITGENVSFGQLSKEELIQLLE